MTEAQLVCIRRLLTRILNKRQHRHQTLDVALGKAKYKLWLAYTTMPDHQLALMLAQSGTEPLCKSRSRLTKSS